MSFACPVCKTAFQVPEEMLTGPIVKWTCEQCGAALLIHRDTGKPEVIGQPHSPDSERDRTPVSPPVSPPSVSSMAPKGKGSSDRVALGVFVVALIALVLIAYSFLSRTKGPVPYSPVRSASKFVSDIERHIKGYLTEIERAIGPHKSRKRKAKKHIFVGYNFYKESKFDKARGEFSRAIEIDPENPAAYFWRGRALLRASRYVEATVDFEMAVKLNPAYADAYDNLGWLYARAGNYNESITCLTRAIELKPENGWAYYYRGRVNHKIGEVHKALRDAKQACRLGLQDGCAMYERLKKKFL